MDLNDGAGARTDPASAAALLGGAPPAGSPPASDPPAGSPPAAAAGTPPAGSPEWYGALSAEKQGDALSDLDWIKESKVGDVNALVKLARDNQRAARDGGRIKVPGENAAPEELATWNKAIGVPEDVSGYSVTAPIGADGQPVPIQTGMIERLADMALKNGMPAPAFKAVIGDVIKMQLEEAAGKDAEEQAAANAWVKAQGAGGSEKLSACDRAFNALELTGSDVVGIRNQLGSVKVLEVFSRIGSSLREDTLTGGGRQSFGLSGNEAKAELKTLQGDPAWREKALIPGTSQNTQYNRLNDMIGEAANRAAAG